VHPLEYVDGDIVLGFIKHEVRGYSDYHTKGAWAFAWEGIKEYQVYSHFADGYLVTGPSVGRLNFLFKGANLSFYTSSQQALKNLLVAILNVVE
jgi:hypothetical protein